MTSTVASVGDGEADSDSGSGWCVETVRVPPCNRTIAATIGETEARPRPASTAASARATAGGKPGPSSATVHLDERADRPRRHEITRVPAACARTAFSSRLLTPARAAWDRRARTGGRQERRPRSASRRIARTGASRVRRARRHRPVHVGPQRAGLDAAHAEQVRDEPVEPFGLVDQDVEQLVRVCSSYVGPAADRSRPRGSRRAACAGRARPNAAMRAVASSTSCSVSTFVVTSALTTNATAPNTTSATISSPRRIRGEPSGGSASSTRASRPRRRRSPAHARRAPPRRHGHDEQQRRNGAR